MLQIPLDIGLPGQEFSIDLDGQNVRLLFMWNSNAKSWFMDIKGVSFDLKFTGLRVCVSQYIMDGLAVREIGDFVLLDLEDLNQEPNFDEFGERWILMYYTKEDLGYDIV